MTPGAGAQSRAPAVFVTSGPSFTIAPRTGAGPAISDAGDPLPRIASSRAPPAPRRRRQLGPAPRAPAPRAARPADHWNCQFVM